MTGSLAGRQDAVLLAVDKLVFESILEFVVYSLVFSVIAKEVPTMDPPDGSLAPLPGAEALFRSLPPQSTP